MAKAEFAAPAFVTYAYEWPHPNESELCIQQTPAIPFGELYEAMPEICGLNSHYTSDGFFRTQPGFEFHDTAVPDQIDR